MEYMFKIDERLPVLEVNKRYKEGIHFPVEMVVCGRKQGKIADTINKPHGKKQIMEFLLTLLAKGPMQYKSFIKQMRQYYAWPDISDSLEILLLDGILQITFKNLKPQKAMEWIPKVIQLDPVFEETSKTSPVYSHAKHDNLKSAMESLLAASISQIKECLMQCLEQREIHYPSGNVIAEQESFRKYRAILLTAAHYVHLKEVGEKLPLRYLSYQIAQSPRFLNTHKDEIANLLQITHQELDSVLLPDIKKDWNASFIFITPIEELLDLIVRLINKAEQSDGESPIIDEMDRLMGRISEIIKDINDSDLEALCNDLVLKVRKNLLNITQENVLDCIWSNICELKKQMLKSEHVTHTFELILLEEIGVGSFARVYKAFDPDLKKFVACKVLFPMTHFRQAYGNDGEEYLLRFKREVRLLTRELKHKNIVEVQKVHVEGFPFWFTMPLASFSLEKWIKDNRSASREQRIHIFLEILSGVKYLHEKEKYHRDLAPSNILLYDSGERLDVKIADLGLAKDPKSQSFFTGSQKANYGHKSFTDPDQLINLSNSSCLSDIYSLGALLYYIWCGKDPKKIAYVTIECQDIVAKAMAKKRLRYKSLHEFEHDLYLFLKCIGYDYCNGSD